MSGLLAFVRDQIVLPSGRRVGEGIAADPWIERDVLAPVFARRPDGLPLHALVYLELARGHWKSGAGAGIALTEAVLSDQSTDVTVAAADRDQAAIILENLDGYVTRNPTLGELVERRGDERLIVGNGSRIRVISSDAPTAWGLGGTHERFRLICDELTVWKGPALWEALVSATGKVPDVQTVVLSNAGFAPGDRCWQWKVRESAQREPWGHLFAPEGVIASWITSEWVERMRTLLPPSAFKRVILNRWSSGVGDFVTAEQWARCVDETLRPSAGHVQGRRYVAAVDLGLTKDRTALAVMHTEGGRAVLDQLEVWQGTATRPVEIADIEAALIDAARRYRTLRVLADPWQFQGSIQRLRRAGLAIEEFTFGTGSVQRLSAALYRAVTTAQLRVFPDVELEHEILGLVVRETPGGWRIDHRAGGFSDRAIALAMAAQAVLDDRNPYIDPALLERALRHALVETGDLMTRPM